MDYPTTRKEAKAQGLPYYFTGKPCTNGHVALRKTKGVCIECMKAEWQAAASTRAEYFAAYNKSEQGKENKRKYYEANRSTVIARAKARPNVEKMVHRKTHKAANPTMYKAHVNTRRRRHREATPKWITPAQRKEMRNLYVIAITMSETTKEQYSVDHIVPLQGDIVCGLHVPWNLRVITHTANMLKNNTWDPDNPDGRFVLTE